MSMVEGEISWSDPSSPLRSEWKAAPKKSRILLCGNRTSLAVRLAAPTAYPDACRSLRTEANHFLPAGETICSPKTLEGTALSDKVSESWPQVSFISFRKSFPPLSKKVDKGNSRSIRTHSPAMRSWTGQAATPPGPQRNGTGRIRPDPKDARPGCLWGRSFPAGIIFS